MTLLLSIVLTVVISLLVTLVLLNVRTPHYRTDRRQARQLLQWMLLGQANEHQWRIFCAMPIRHDPPLEQIRSRCAELDELHFVGDQRGGRLLDRAGMVELEELLQQLQQLDGQEER